MSKHTPAPNVPFPALTPTQRLHLELNGFVVLEKLISPERVEVLRGTIYEMEARYRATGELPGPDCHLSETREDFWRVDNLPHLAPCFFDYLVDARIVGMAEEICGGKVRLEQSDAHIRRADDEGGGYGFRRGIYGGFSHTGKGLYHFTFVKALTNLTDLGPDDGGTTVIPGTHKIEREVADRDIIQAAMEDPILIHQVEAPAGSTLLFFESLMHSHGIIRSDRDRLLILGGYMPTMFQTWHGYEPSAEFAAGLSDQHRALLTGEGKFGWRERTRELSAPAQLTSEQA